MYRVEPQQRSQQIHCFVSREFLVLFVDELRHVGFGELAGAGVLQGQLHLVTQLLCFRHELLVLNCKTKNLLGAQELRELVDLVEGVDPLDQWRLAEDLHWMDSYHTSKDHANCPNIDSIVVADAPQEYLRSLIVEAGHLRRVVLLGVVILSESKVNNLERTFIVINEDVMRLDVPVHDSPGVNIVEGLRRTAVTERSSRM